MITPTTIVSTLLLASRALLASGVHGGLYVLIVPVLVALTGGVASAWPFLTKITKSRAVARPSSRTRVRSNRSR